MKFQSLIEIFLYHILKSQMKKLLIIVLTICLHMKKTMIYLSIEIKNIGNDQTSRKLIIQSVEIPLTNLNAPVVS